MASFDLAPVMLPGSTWKLPRARAVRPSARAGGAGAGGGGGLPRKEVIQPHVPVRLPCYDFTPITDPTLVACLPPPGGRGLARRLRVLPAFVV